VQAAFPEIARQVVLVGQSQGAGAAFATAGLAATYAPEVALRGTVATGVPFLGEPPRRPEPSDTADPTVAYLLYIGVMMQQRDPALTAESLFTPRAQPLFEAARATCVWPLFQKVKEAGLNRSNALAPGFGKAFASVLVDLQYGTVRLPQPLFVGTGAQDHDVPPARQLALVRNACTVGTVVEAHLYAGLDHSATVNASLKDSVPFVRKVLAGERIAPVCEPEAE
jgi:pimeloyl-ACP methyl ester carboxylesterase